MTTTARNAFEYLCDRILRKRCMPLIGAGISFGSTKGGQKWDGHKVWSMIDEVVGPTVEKRLERFVSDTTQAGTAAALCLPCFWLFAENIRRVESIKTRLNLTSGACVLCELRQTKERDALTKACEAYLWEHGGPNREATYSKLVDALKIEQFADLDPTPAHYFLAFLAREGLVTEFVTTNYDASLEKAYRSTWSNSTSVTDTLVSPIYDLGSFAVNAADSAKWRPGRDTEHPMKVFKINGCATELRRKKEHAKNVLLTASQLQDWRARRWAADYFRTKVRTASLVTIGFGSDEPQVIHTLQQVLEEFSGFDSDFASRCNQSLFSAGNAPVVTMYEPYPSFQQLQLVCGFASWFNGACALGERLLIGPSQREAKKSLDVDGLEPAGEKLAADVLWADVYQAVFGKLLVRELGNLGTSNSAAITAAVPYAGSWFGFVAETLEDAIEDAMAQNGRLSHWLTELKSVIDGQPARPPQLTLCVAHLLGKLVSASCYTALSDHGNLFIELVLLLVLLREVESGSDQQHAPSVPVDTARNVWQRIVFRDGNVIEIPVATTTEGVVSGQTSIFVSRALSSLHQASHSVDTGGQSAKRLELVIGNGPRRPFDLERRAFAVTADGQAPVTLLRLDWSALFPPDLPVKSYQDVSRRINDAIHFPTKYRRRLDRSLRTNPFLEPAKTS